MVEWEWLDCPVQFGPSCLCLQHKVKLNIKNSVSVTSLLFMFAYVHEKARRVFLQLPAEVLQTAS